MTVIEWGEGVKAASNGSAPTGRFARLPKNGNAASRPQNDISNFGLIKTMSATARILRAFRRKVLTTISRPWSSAPGGAK